jgi:hypothetical protein
MRAAETRSASLAIRAAIDDPRRVSFVVPMEGRSARYVRVRLDEDHESVPWIMTDLDVLRTDGARR